MSAHAAERLKVVRAATRLSVFVAEPQQRGQRLAVTALMERAAALGVSGGTVLAGFAGFGHHRQLHEPHLLHGPDKTPLVAVFVDLPERLAPLRPVIAELLPGALVVSDEVTSIRYIRAHRHG